MVRVRVLGNDDLLGRSEGAASFILRDFYGGLGAVAFLFMTMLMVAARRGRGRGRGHGCSRDVTERQEDHVSRPEIVQNCYRVNREINSSDGDNSSGEIRVNCSSVNRKPRTHSSGIYGKPPPSDKIRAIPVGEGHIMDPEATRTMLTIIHQHWPRYYRYEDDISERQGDEHVLTHVNNRMRSIKGDEKIRTFKRAAKNGKPLVDQQPEYFSNAVWISFCNHFLGEKHGSKSEINKRNRMKKVVIHATGSTSHAQIKRELTVAKNRPPTRLELFERTYKHKSTQNYTSEEARKIAVSFNLRIIHA